MSTASQPCVTISGYTGRDNLNQLTGITDTTDWRLDDVWSQCEMDLFGATSFNTNCSFNDSFLTNPSAYPNPTTDMFRIDLGVQVMDSALAKRDTAIKVDLLFLNQRLQNVGFLQTNKYQLRFTNFSINSMNGISTDSIFRVYYKLTDSTNCVRTGHGDIVRR